MCYFVHQDDVDYSGKVLERYEKLGLNLHFETRYTSPKCSVLLWCMVGFYLLFICCFVVLGIEPIVGKSYTPSAYLF